MIEVQNLTKSFSGFQALSGASLTVPAGSIYGLVGPNGAGKSTLIRHLTGIYRQDSGEALLDGAPIYETRMRRCVSPPSRMTGISFRRPMSAI